MSTIIMYSKPYIDDTKNQINKEITSIKSQTGKVPKLTVIQANNDKASDTYIKNKRKCCEDVGMQFELVKINTDISTDLLYNRILEEITNQHDANGIIVQKPIDKLNTQQEQNIFNAIMPQKDVDALGKDKTFELYLNNSDYLPCTVQGVIDILDYYKIPIEGKHVVIVGRSNIVGKPLALALLNRNATVTMCHSKTENLEEYTKQADILICAVGKAKFIKEQHLSLRTKVVIDVGINRDENNKLCGDCDFDNIMNYWEHSPIFDDRYITPVPKGIGPLTVLNLIKNTFQAFKNNLNKF